MNRTQLVTTYYRQLATLTKAGFSLMRALRIIADRTSNRAFAEIVRGLITQVEKGNTFWEALQTQPRYFPSYQTQIVRAGETSGNLTTVLDRLATAGMRDVTLRNQIRSLLAYPAIVLVVAVSLIGFLAISVIPTFVALFEEIEAPLPKPTRFLIFASKLVADHWFALALGLVLGVLLVRFAITLRPVRRVLHRLKLNSTLLGPLTKEYVVVQTCRTLGMLLQSGINLLRALELTRNATPNLVVADALERTRLEATQGRSLEVPLREARIFPALVVDMIMTGQETGALGENLLHAAEIYEEELETKMRIITSLTEPVMALLVGTLVMFVALSLFLPYIRLLLAITAGEGLE